MCPLVSSPGRGYTDYQRISNYDTGILWSAPGTSGVGTVTSSVINVSRHAYAGGRIGETQSQCFATFLWAVDEAMSVIVGARQVAFTSLIQNVAQLRIPNLGPFLQIQASSIASGAFTLFARILATNRVHPLEFIPVSQTCIDSQALPVPANTSVDAYPTDYYSGPVNVSVNPSFATGELDVQYLTVGGAWDTIDLRTWTTANPFSFLTVVPAGAWRFHIHNGTAAASQTAVVATPSTTGAS